MDENSVYTFIITKATAEQLDRFQRAVKNRRDAIADRTQRQLQVGSIVFVNDRISPKYLSGRKGTVLKINRKTVEVMLDHPVNRGRFWGDVTIAFPATCLTPTGQVNDSYGIKAYKHASEGRWGVNTI